MTYQEIASMVASVDLSYAYDHFNVDEDNPPPVPPFICFRYNNVSFFADNINYLNKAHITVELYTDNKDYTNTAALEAAFSNAGLTYISSEDFNADEELYVTTYEMEAIING